VWERLTLFWIQHISLLLPAIWERVTYTSKNEGVTTEGATAPETLRSTDRMAVKTLESGWFGLTPRRRS